MENISALLLFVSFISLIVGLIHPMFFAKIFRTNVTRKFILTIFGTSSVIFFIIFGIFAPPVEKVQPQKVNIKINNVIQEIASSTLDSTVQTSPTDIKINNEATAIEESKTVETTKISATQTNESTDTPSKDAYVYYSVSSVVDGDTLKINMSGSIVTLRLIGMDTPEVVDPRKTVQCFGKEASNKAKELLIGKKIRIEKDPTQGDLDKYGRTLAYVFREDGLFYNKYMIEQGYAHEYTYNTPYKYQTEFKSAQKSAQTNLLGLWSPNTCNGDTTQSATTTTISVPVTDKTTTPITITTGKYYTSSFYSSKYYYQESCPGWKSLSPKYLKSFDSIESLLKAYPSRTLSPECQ